MTKRTRVAIVPLVVFWGLYGCDSVTSRPTAPDVPGPPIPTPPAATGMLMRGTVHDTAFRPLAGATVEVLDGPQSGLSTTADGRGDFSLTGIFDDATRFRATKEGHVSATETLEPFCATCNPNRWINFSLEVLTAPVHLSGDYTLNFVANSTCTMLPDDLRSRTFTATLQQSPTASPGNRFSRVVVGGATFFEDWNVVEMGIAGDYVAFWLEVLVEQISPNAFLAFGGQAAASIGTSDMSTITLPFAGSIDYCVTPSEKGRFQECLQGQSITRARCDSNNHQLILTRR